MKLVETVMASWAQNDESNPNESLWCDADNVYSYTTCVVAFTEVDGEGVAYLNMTKYGATTTRHQNAIREWFRQRPATFVNVIERTNMRVNARPQDLIDDIRVAGAPAERLEARKSPSIYQYNPEVGF
jgi:hypothetical protein